MIKFFREKKNYFVWVLWVVVAIFVIYIFVDFGSSKFKGGDQPWAAMVDGEMIPVRDFQNAWRQVEENYQQMLRQQITPQLRKQFDIPRAALGQLVDRKLLEREARRLGLIATDQEVAEEIRNSPSFQQDGKFVGPEKYRAALRYLQTTPTEFEEQIRGDILTRKFRHLLAGSVVLPDALVEEEYRRRNEKATIRYVHLPAGNLEAEVTLGAEDARHYYDAHKDEFRVGERRRLNYLLVDTAKLRATPTDEAVEARYRSRISEYATGEAVRARHILLKVENESDRPRAQAQAEKLLSDLRGGADFAALVAKYSDDLASKARGGDLGFFERGQMPPPFEEASFATPPGALVDHVVESQGGFHIIQVVEKRPPGAKPLEAVKAQIAATMAQEAAEGEARRRAEELMRTAGKDATDDVLRNMADPTGTVTFLSSDPFERTEPIPGLGRNEALTEAAFAAKAGELLPQAIEVARGWAIVKVAEVLPAGIRGFDEVKEKVETEARREKARALAATRLGESWQAVREESLDKLAKGLSLSVESPAEITRGGSIPGLPSGGRALLEAVFAADAGSYVGPLALPGGGAVLAHVESKTGFDAAAFAATRESVRDSLRDQESQRLLGTLLGNLRSSASVKLNEEMLKRLVG